MHHIYIRKVHSLHLLPVAGCARYKTMILAYKAINGPSHLKALVIPCTLFNPPALFNWSRHLSRYKKDLLLDSSLRWH